MGRDGVSTLVLSNISAGRGGRGEGAVVICLDILYMNFSPLLY